MNSSNKLDIRILVLLGLIAWCCPASLIGAEAKPNLILIMADDLG